MGQDMCYGYHIWSKEALMQAENNDDLYRGQRSSEVKCGKLCDMTTIFGQKICWCKLRMMMTFTEVKGHQRSNVVNYATKLGRKSSWCQFRMTVTFMEVKGQQRSNTGNNISSCECNKVVSAFLLFCRRGNFVFQTIFSDCWKIKRKGKLNRIKILLFLYDINDLLFVIQNH